MDKIKDIQIVTANNAVEAENNKAGAEFLAELHLTSAAIRQYMQKTLTGGDTIFTLRKGSKDASRKTKFGISPMYECIVVENATDVVSSETHADIHSKNGLTTTSITIVPKMEQGIADEKRVIRLSVDDFGNSGDGYSTEPIRAHVSLEVSPEGQARFDDQVLAVSIKEEKAEGVFVYDEIHGGMGELTKDKFIKDYLGKAKDIMKEVAIKLQEKLKAEEDARKAEIEQQEQEVRDKIMATLDDVL